MIKINPYSIENKNELALPLSIISSAQTLGLLLELYLSEVEVDNPADERYLASLIGDMETLRSDIFKVNLPEDDQDYDQGYDQDSDQEVEEVFEGFETLD